MGRAALLSWWPQSRRVCVQWTRAVRQAGCRAGFSRNVPPPSRDPRQPPLPPRASAPHPGPALTCCSPVFPRSTGCGRAFSSLCRSHANNLRGTAGCVPAAVPPGKLRPQPAPPAGQRPACHSQPRLQLLRPPPPSRPWVGSAFCWGPSRQLRHPHPTSRRELQLRPLTCCQGVRIWQR